MRDTKDETIPSTRSHQERGLFVVFEGIDGSGKSTISNKVAKLLRKQGVKTEHTREGDTYDAPLVTRMREFGKDPQNLAMAPLSELMLYLSREVQLLDECTLPALAEFEVVIADRSLDSCEVLAVDGRGLPLKQVRTIVEAAGSGLRADLTILLDVDPDVSRARQKLEKLRMRAKGSSASSGSRKGLASVGTRRLLREGYLRLAQERSDTWLVYDNTSADPNELAEQIADRVIAHRSGEQLREVTEEVTKAAVSVRENQEHGDPVAAATRRQSLAPTLSNVVELFRRRLDELESIEPGIAAYFISGMETPLADELRLRLASATPHMVAHGLRGVNSQVSWDLRHSLAAVSPRFIARSLEGNAPRTNALRETLYAHAPSSVIGSIAGLNTESAWGLRVRALGDEPVAVISSLCFIDSSMAWELRQWGLKSWSTDTELSDPELSQQGLSALIRSLKGIDSPRAWDIRDAFMEAHPAAVLSSLNGIFSDRAWTLRERFAKTAGKIVLRTFDGCCDERAWRLRERCARRCKETFDSMRGLDGERAWSLRRRYLGLWPSTVINSLGELASEDAGLELSQRALQDHPNHPSLLKHLNQHYATRNDSPPLRASDLLHAKAATEFGAVGDTRPKGAGPKGVQL